MTKHLRVYHTGRLFLFFNDLMERLGATVVPGEPERPPEACGDASPVTQTWSIQTTRGEYRCHCYGNLNPKFGIGWIAGHFPGKEAPNHKKNFHFDQIAPIYAIEGIFKPWIQSILTEKEAGTHAN